MQQLDGDPAVQRDVPAVPDLAHPAAPDQLVQAVPPGEHPHLGHLCLPGLPDRAREFCHGPARPESYQLAVTGPGPFGRVVGAGRRVPAAACPGRWLGSPQVVGRFVADRWAWRG
ncbi:hypothetical protein GCM10009759_60540 [Kitasatospora saccharophila]|uniref:Uncharacterized protein n=1 Tax=Kitasatospora saccharophila TaxID=407973 RepID=A0ABN2XT26_9ACTN